MAAKLPTVLTIAGSDPSGGAGVEADIKVITAHGCYAMTTFTALTAQNTTGVRDIHYVPEDFVAASLRAVFEDMPVDVVKTGMLGLVSTIEVVGNMVRNWNVQKLVVDPVMVSTSGSKLLADGAVESLIRNLLPHTFILTPNLPEALLLLNMSDAQVEDIQDMKTIARRLSSLGPQYVLLKGGHVPMTRDGLRVAEGQKGEIVVDVLFHGETQAFEVIKKPFIDSRNTHGTGCSLASAIASNLAKGFETVAAVKEASKYIAWAIETAPNFGGGNGPINHIHSNYMIPFAPGYFLDYLKEHPKVKQVWEEYTKHDFIKRLGKGTLEQEQFSYYLKQDYLFLIQFARAHSLAGFKSLTLEDILASAKTVEHIFKESRLHIAYCAGFGITQQEIEDTEEDIACTAYTRYVLDIGQSHDFLALQVALAPCLFGYHQIAKWLLKHPDTKRQGNPYYNWILTYGQSESYTDAVRIGRKLLETKVRAAGPDRLEELVDIFAHATKMEKGFWTMGLEGPARNLAAKEHTNLG